LKQAPRDATVGPVSTEVEEMARKGYRSAGLIDEYRLFLGDGATCSAGHVRPTALVLMLVAIMFHLPQSCSYLYAT
jgi:hypothetical protein